MAARIRLYQAALTLTATAICGDAFAQGSKVSSAVELAQKADDLKPGDWVWAADIAPDGPVTVYVDLSRQIATVYRNGVRIGIATISSGKPGHETPSGVFTILQKDAKHRSSKYNNAPMPYQERLTWDGVALHAGGLPGYPESHGCIHLPYEFSRLLFGTTEMGGTVVIAGSAGSAMRVSAPGVLAPIGTSGADTAPAALPADESYRWEPQKSATGPVSVILSKSDQRAVVLRNGVEIGRARIAMPDGDYGTHVLTLVKDAQGRPNWIYVGVPGHAGETGHALDSTVADRVQMPAPFREAVASIIQPGATILVTQAGVGAHTTGPRLAVLSGSPDAPPGSSRSR